MRFSLRNCEIAETTHYTTFSCRNEPTYVLTRKCTNEYYGAAGPCCKFDDAFNYLLNDRADLAATLKYALHGDDDTFFRPDQVLRWLAAVEKAGLGAVPLIGNLNMHVDKGPGVWHIKGCMEVQVNGWYQPVVLNAAALALLKTPVAAYGTQATCKAFDVTHDIGLGLLGWLYGMYHLQIPGAESNPGHKGVEILKPQQVSS